MFPSLYVHAMQCFLRRKDVFWCFRKCFEAFFFGSKCFPRTSAHQGSYFQKHFSFFCDREPCSDLYANCTQNCVQMIRLCNAILRQPPLRPEKFEKAALFLRLGPPSKLIRHENGAFRKRSSNWSRIWCDFSDRVFFKHKSKMTGDCYCRRGLNYRIQRQLTTCTWLKKYKFAFGTELCKL